MLMENAMKHTKDVLIRFLRLYFNNPKNYKNKLPPQISDEHFKDMPIYDAEPEELRQLPTVIITSGSGNMVTAGLADMCSEILDPRNGSIIAYRYQGFYEFNIVIDIGTRNPLEREVLTDLISKAIRFSLRRFIQNQGIIIKDASYAGETTVQYNSDKIYVSQLRFNTWSCWVEDVDLLDPNEFNINMSMTVEKEDGTSSKPVNVKKWNRGDVQNNGEN